MRANTSKKISTVNSRGGGGRLLGLLSGLRRPPDLGYQYRRILPQKVANRTWKSELFYSSSHLALFWDDIRHFSDLLAMKYEEEVNRYVASHPSHPLNAG